MSRPPGDDPFRAFHAHRRRAALVRALRALVVVVPLGAGVAALWVTGHDAPVAANAGPASVVEVVEQAAEQQGEVSGPTLPEAAPPPPASEPVPPVIEAPASVPQVPAPLEIVIDAVGFQAEIDRCLWVRMDLGVVAPLVGAHNSCGGDVVLGLDAGDEVRLAGFGLDGTYVVTDAREVRTGEIAAVATEGMTADVILQTCYRGTGTTRLVAASRLP